MCSETRSCRLSRPCSKCKSKSAAPKAAPIRIESYSDWEVTPGEVTLTLGNQQFIIDSGVAYDLGSELTSAADRY